MNSEYDFRNALVFDWTGAGGLPDHDASISRCPCPRAAGVDRQRWRRRRGSAGRVTPFGRLGVIGGDATGIAALSPVVEQANDCRHRRVNHPSDVNESRQNSVGHYPYRSAQITLADIISSQLNWTWDRVHSSVQLADLR